MDRRDFLKAAAAIPAAAYLPSAEARHGLDLKTFKMAVNAIQQGADSPWYAFIHPSQERDLIDLAARERWHGAYQDWRKDGKPPMTCRAILEKYRPEKILETEWDGNIGTYEGFRFIQSDSVI